MYCPRHTLVRPLAYIAGFFVTFTAHDKSYALEANMRFDDLLQSVSDPVLRAAMEDVIAISLRHKDVSTAKLEAGVKWLRRVLVEEDEEVKAFFEADDDADADATANTEDLLDPSMLEDNPQPYGDSTARL